MPGSAASANLAALPLAPLLYPFPFMSFNHLDTIKRGVYVRK